MRDPNLAESPDAAANNLSIASASTLSRSAGRGAFQ
jgi:hypothetical protein